MHVDFRLNRQRVQLVLMRALAPVSGSNLSGIKTNANMPCTTAATTTMRGRRSSALLFGDFHFFTVLLSFHLAGCRVGVAAKNCCGSTLTPKRGWSTGRWEGTHVLATGTQPRIRTKRTNKTDNLTRVALRNFQLPTEGRSRGQGVENSGGKILMRFSY